MRKRLSWDEAKVAEIAKQADPYTMNQDRSNPPVEKYQTGDPSAWAEDPDMSTPWKTEGRTETGHPAPAREAVVAARKLEDKALKCITIAQRMLPGATDELLEEQATDLMYLPEKSILSTLQRQASLADSLSEEKVASDDDNDEDEDDKKAEKAASDDDKDEDDKKAEKAASDDDEDEDDKKAEKAASDDDKDEDKKAEKSAKGKKKEKSAPANGAEKEVAAPEEVVEEEVVEEVVNASVDLLDQIFETTEVSKTGPKKLSGTVKIPAAQITPEEMTSSVTVSNDVILVNDGEEVREPYWPLSIRLSVQLGEDVRIDGYGLKGRLAGGLELQDVPDSFLTATGGLDFIDSSFTIFGRSFEIERGRVLFTGGPIDNPGIDVRAQKKVSAEEAKGDGYVVGVDVNGLVQNLQFHLFSDPFMEDTDILSHLLVGHSLADSSEEENNILGAAAVALGVKGGSAIFQHVGDLFSVDDLHLEGTSEKEDISLVVGKRITKDLYFGYDINMFSQLGVFRVRYGLARGFSIETQTSTESTGTDILYTFER